VRRYDLMVDVRTVAMDDAATAITVFLPDRLDASARPVAAFGFPGGGYARGYWDISHPGAQGYSQAEYHTARGWVFVACDHLGVGDSAHPAAELLTYETLAAANDATVRAVVSGLAAGSLVEGLPPVAIRSTIGMGQSMGGCLSIVAQGRHRTFDALAVLGFSAIHTQMPTPQGRRALAFAGRGGEADLASSTAALADTFRWAFHWEDVDPALVDADMSSGYPLRGEDHPAWGSRTVPPSAVSMLSPGVVAAEAAAIDVPVLLASGERDVVPDPRAEPSAYASSNDITVVVVPAMAHMHNFAGTRRLLWERIHGWGEAVSHAGVG